MKMKHFYMVFLILILIISCFTVASAAKVTTLQLQYSIIGDEAAQRIKQFVAEYQKLHRNIKIDISYIPWENHRAVTISKLVSGNPPDILHSATSQGAIEFMNMNALTDLKPYLQKDLKFKNDFIPATFVELNYHGLPFVQSPEAVVFYRKDLFQKAGIPLPSVDKPWTWDEFLKYAQKLTVDSDNDGKIDQWGFADRGQSGFIFMKSTIPIIWSFGADIVKQVNNKWVSGFDDPKAKEFVQYYVDLTRKYKVRPESYLGWGFAEGLRAWKDGKVAMFGVGAWFADSIKDNTDMKYDEQWDVMLYPTAPGVDKFFYETLDYFHIPKASKHKAEAWNFIRWLYEKERLMPLSKADFDLAPARKSILADPYYSPKNKPMFGNRLSTWSEHAKFMPSCPDYSVLWTGTVEPILQSAVLGRISVEEAISQLNTNINKKLNH
jgi:multiple sugar transport system substrate-binding protein